MMLFFISTTPANLLFIIDFVSSILLSRYPSSGTKIPINPLQKLEKKLEMLFFISIRPSAKLSKASPIELNGETRKSNVSTKKSPMLSQKSPIEPQASDHQLSEGSPPFGSLGVGTGGGS